jgi:hyaluronan synthase
MLEFYIPLGIIGLWRWGVWGLKKVVGSFYRPKTTPYAASVSIVTPVYNEDPSVFYKALQSWVLNNPYEIIAVIDFTDTACIETFKRFSHTVPNATLVLTKTPGKRPALADGIRLAQGDIVALVDCDTMWAEHTLQEGLCPFSDPLVGGVATKQGVLTPRTLAQRIFSILLDLRYSDDLTFLSASGPYLRCLSGRTAFYRRVALLPLLEDLVSETFLGQKVISGDDKRLTYTLQAAGWHTYYQSSSCVYTPGMQGFTAFINQKIRWTRNSWREDIAAFFTMGFIRKSPIFLLGFIDSAIQPFTLLLSPLFFVASLLHKHWVPALFIVVWWLLSRTIKLMPHLRNVPKDIVLVPLYVPFTFYSGVIKIYALVSLNTQGWITRWDKTRLTQFSYFYRYGQYAITLCLILFVGVPVLSLRPTYSEETPLVDTSPILEKRLGTVAKTTAYAPIVLKHTVEPGEYLTTVAQRYNVAPGEIVKYNFTILPNWNALEVGTVLTIPLRAINYEPARIFNFERAHLPVSLVVFNPETNTLRVDGRGVTVTLQQLAERDNYTHIKEVEPKVWLVSSHIVIGNGVSFNVTESEVDWLRLTSDKTRFVTIRSSNGRLFFDGVKVTSWDPATETVDTNYADGRAYILAQGNGRLDITNSELAFLGYKKEGGTPGGTYGVSWRIPSRAFGKYFMTGDVASSTFHHNYFGAYTYGVSGMTWKNNQFYSNVAYGLDPHDDSNNFLVANNLFFNNGTHGLIFSKRCFGNYVVDNVSFYNKLHGVMLHEASNGNYILRNRIFGNTDGIAIYNSDANAITGNIVLANETGVRVNQNSRGNAFVDNTVTNNTGYGFYFYGNARENQVKHNTITLNHKGTYLKSGGNEFVDNTITENNYGIYLYPGSESNRFHNNLIDSNVSHEVYAQPASQLRTARF